MSENGITSGAALRKRSRIHVTVRDTGNTYLMRRPNITDLINSKALPENFVSQTLEILAKDEPQEAPEKKLLTDTDLLKGEAVMKAMVTASMLQPRIVDEATAEDEIEFYDIPPEDRQYLFLWAKGELPDVPLQTEDGETTVEAVETFSDGEGRGESLGVVNPIEAVGENSLADVGATA